MMTLREIATEVDLSGYSRAVEWVNARDIKHVDMGRRSTYGPESRLYSRDDIADAILAVGKGLVARGEKMIERARAIRAGGE